MNTAPGVPLLPSPMSGAVKNQDSFMIAMNLEADVTYNLSLGYDPNEPQPLDPQPDPDLVLRSSSLYASASSDVIVIPKPEGVVQGDLVVVSFAYVPLDAENAPVTHPSGWSGGYSVHSADFICYFMAKRMGSSEPESWTWTFDRSRKRYAHAYAFSSGFSKTGTSAIQATLVDHELSTPGTSVPIPGYTTTADKQNSIYIAVARSAVEALFTVPSGHTEHIDAGSLEAEIWQAMAARQVPTSGTVLSPTSYDVSVESPSRVGGHVIVKPMDVVYEPDESNSLFMEIFGPGVPDGVQYMEIYDYYVDGVYSSSVPLPLVFTPTESGIYILSVYGDWVGGSEAEFLLTHDCPPSMPSSTKFNLIESGGVHVWPS